MMQNQRTALLLVPTLRSTRILSRLLVSGAGLCVLAAIVAPWQQNLSGSGKVVAYSPNERPQEVDAPIEGRVTTWHVREGSHVNAGDVLLQITDNAPEILGRLADEREAGIARREQAVSRALFIRNRQRALESSKDAGIRAAVNRMSMAKERTRGARQALEAAQAGLVAAKSNLERQTGLVEKGLTSVRTVELAQLDAARGATEVERAQASQQAALSEEAALEADRFRLEHDMTASIDDAHAQEATALAEEANAAAELARLEVRLSRQQTMELKAPVDGTVLRVALGQGNSFVKAGEPLLTLVPDAVERAVELFIDGNDMPLLQVGRPVRLQFEGWPAVQFSGWPSVAVGTFGGTVALIDASDDGKGRFRILVRPDGVDAWPTGSYLRQGVRANGWVLLDSVRLGFELWRRFNGFPPAVQPAKPPEKKGS
jgi:multidrug resistance efflux pump